MALFVLACFDHEDALDRRMAVRPNHLAYVDANRERLKLAGPMFDAAGRMAGSLFILDVEDEAAVEAFSAADPYRLNNVFERVEIRGFKVSVGALP
ncbi:MAG: YciI family protein [Caulobacteraceae bacterium]|nr:YciI family protein [Caulobacteraceae bacterium]